MKLVVLEGPDGAGKTTLAKEAKHLEYIHFGPPAPGKLGAWFQYMDLLKDLWDFPRPGGVIIDRFIYGELIYGPVLRGGTALTWAHIRMLERVLMGLNARLVVCLPPFETVLANWGRNKANELIKDEDLLWEVYEFYLNLLGDKQRMLPRQGFDYTTNHAVNPMEYGIAYENTGPGIGAFHPGNILLVGDQVNPRTGKEGWPFVSHQGSSMWLANLLEAAQIPEHGLYWVNARIEGQEINPRFIDRLEPRKIIALGGKAAAWCNKHVGCEFFTVAHPQYHKRFHTGDTYPLLELLK